MEVGSGQNQDQISGAIAIHVGLDDRVSTAFEPSYALGLDVRVVTAEVERLVPPSISRCVDCRQSNEIHSMHEIRYDVWRSGAAVRRCGEHEPVGTRAAGQHVGPGAANKTIVTVIALEDIVEGRAD